MSSCTYLIQDIFLIFCFVQMATGGVVAHFLSDRYPSWVRFLSLAPSFSAMYYIWGAINGTYIAYVPDIVDALSTTTLYIMFAICLNRLNQCRAGQK